MLARLVLARMDVLLCAVQSLRSSSWVLLYADCIWRNIITDDAAARACLWIKSFLCNMRHKQSLILRNRYALCCSGAHIHIRMYLDRNLDCANMTMCDINLVYVSIQTGQ